MGYKGFNCTSYVDQLLDSDRRSLFLVSIRGIIFIWCFITSTGEQALCSLRGTVSAGGGTMARVTGLDQWENGPWSGSLRYVYLCVHIATLQVWFENLYTSSTLTSASGVLVLVILSEAAIWSICHCMAAASDRMTGITHSSWGGLVTHNEIRPCLMEPTQPGVRPMQLYTT